MKPTIALAAVLFALPTGRSVPSAPAPLHCQVPCGIYGDRMRIDMLMEDCATIEKGMAQIKELESSTTNSNQVVRWVLTKDQHAAAIQEQVASYWLAQRIKAPADGSDAEARAKYVRQLEAMHGITVAAMKCKQTTDPAHVAAIGKLALAFSETYFSPEDLEHIRGHQSGAPR